MIKNTLFTFGHRKHHGKGTCAKMVMDYCFQNQIRAKRRSFADMMKEQCSKRYNLNNLLMSDPKYKQSKPEHLLGLTVRDVLLKEGAFARSIWEYAWASSLYKRVSIDFVNGVQVIVVNDLRFANEYDFLQASLADVRLVSILVHRKNGIFDDDGADAELPDEEGFGSVWKYIVENDDESELWIDGLREQTLEIVRKELKR